MYQKFSIFQLLLKIQKLYLLITFKRGIVLNFFSTHLESVWNSAFFDTYFDLKKKKYFRSYLHFLQTFKPNAAKTAQNNQKKYFIKMF